MKVLVLGSGAREHALCWKLRQTRGVEVLAGPGNPGIADVAETVSVTPTDAAGVVALAKARAVQLVVIGPEAPLVAGVADALRAAQLPVFGPSAEGARLEGSKAHAKHVMAAAGVPTARFELFDDAGAAARRAREWGAVVVKADGLAAGKGVVVADDGEQAAAACLSLGALPAGKTILLEERLSGPELSVMALCDGRSFALLAPSQDHKRVFDGDRGPNTGGMGAYAPAQLVSDAALEEIGRTVIAPTLAELRRRGVDYRGALYAGLMLTPSGPKVLEFNARLGDPETQVLMMQLDAPLAELLLACATGTLSLERLPQREGASVGVVLASEGYPDGPTLGDEIVLPPLGAEELLFHAGTSLHSGRLVTAGGRVLTACARGATVAQARARATSLAERVTFRGRHFRTDIGALAP